MPRAWKNAVVVGSGPNGLCAAIALAQAGMSVVVREGAACIGGSCRSEDLTLPGFVHDSCASVLALSTLSSCLRALPLAEHGLDLVYPTAAFAHPLDDGPAVVAFRSVEQTADELASDAYAYRRLLTPLVMRASQLADDLLRPPGVPADPLGAMRFGITGLRSAKSLAQGVFRSTAARAMLAGVAAHSAVPLDFPATAATALMLLISAHAAGWPIARGGSQNLTNALASVLRSHGGKIVTSTPVTTIDEFPQSTLVLLDVTPRQLIELAGHRLSQHYVGRLRRYRYGAGTCKVDFALDGPIPWRDSRCRLAATVHIGNTFEQIAASEQAAWTGRHSDRPSIILVQPTLFDPSRAPAGKHTAWAYCHVPHGSDVDMTSVIESQIERFAPGFRDRILARHTRTAPMLQAHNPNLIGGDINGGAAILSQLLLRPLWSINPYSTPIPNVYLCSSSTPPGGGIHGLCGFHAARLAIG
jgi:phytoene dehydrogenase-like protein